MERAARLRKRLAPWEDSHRALRATAVCAADASILDQVSRVRRLCACVGCRRCARIGRPDSCLVRGAFPPMGAPRFLVERVHAGALLLVDHRSRLSGKRSPVSSLFSLRWGARFYRVPGNCFVQSGPRSRASGPMLTIWAARSRSHYERLRKNPQSPALCLSCPLEGVPLMHGTWLPEPGRRLSWR